MPKVRVRLVTANDAFFPERGWREVDLVKDFGAASHEEAEELMTDDYFENDLRDHLLNELHFEWERISDDE